MKHKTRWTAKKIAQRLRLIEPLVYRQQHLIPPFRYTTLPGPEAEPLVGPAVDDSRWDTIAPHSYWGSWLTDFVLRTTFTVPEEWPADAPVALYLPLAFPAMVAAFLAFHWLGNAGLLSRIAWQLGWISEPRQFPDLINDPWGIGIILTHYAMATPFFTLMFKAIYADNRVGELCLAGASMGATRSEQVRRIALPLLWQKARPTLLLYGVFVAGSYEIPLILGVQSPQMISVYAVTKMNRFDLNTRPQAYIIALLFTVIVGGLLRWGMGRGR